MIHKFILYIFCCFSFYNTFSQEIKRGEIIKDRQFLIDKTELTASDESGNFVSIRPHRINGTLRNYFVEFFDHLDFKDRVEIETKNETDILDVSIINGNVFILIKEKFDRTISIRFDIVNLITKSKREEILHELSKDDNSPEYRAIDDNYNISVDYSSDITLSFPVFNKRESYVVAKVFSSKLENLSNHILTVANSESFDNISYLNLKRFNDKFYALFKISESNKLFYKLIEYDNHQQTSIDILINSETYELINSKINDSNYYICGLYSYNKKGGFDGFTYYNINLETFTVKFQKQSKFLDGRATKYFNGLFKGNRNIDLNNIFIDQNHNTYLIGQFYSLKREYVPVSLAIAPINAFGMVGYITMNPISYTYKVYDDLLMAKINTEGELEWDNLLELRQTEEISSKSNKRDTSTFSFFSNNQLHIFMNGYINMEEDRLIVKQDKRLSKTNFYNVIIDTHGNINPEKLFSNEDSEILFRAEHTVKSGNDIYILGQGNMRKQLLKMRLR